MDAKLTAACAQSDDLWAVIKLGDALIEQVQLIEGARQLPDGDEVRRAHGRLQDALAAYRSKWTRAVIDRADKRHGSGDKPAGEQP